jgi:transposase InsO family protein
LLKTGTLARRAAARNFQVSLALAIFEWIEAWYNPRRRHSSIGSVSPVDYESANNVDDVESAA